MPGRHYSLAEAVSNRVRIARYNWQIGGCLEGSTLFHDTAHLLNKVVPSRHAWRDRLLSGSISYVDATGYKGTGFQPERNPASTDGPTTITHPAPSFFYEEGALFVPTAPLPCRATAGRQSSAGRQRFLQSLCNFLQADCNFLQPLCIFLQADCNFLPAHGSFLPADGSFLPIGWQKTAKGVAEKCQGGCKRLIWPWGGRKRRAIHPKAVPPTAEAAGGTENDVGVERIIQHLRHRRVLRSRGSA